jgi:hypothetical protein
MKRLSWISKYLYYGKSYLEFCVINISNFTFNRRKFYTSSARSLARD